MKTKTEFTRLIRTMTLTNNHVAYDKETVQRMRRIKSGLYVHYERQSCTIPQSLREETPTDNDCINKKKNKAVKKLLKKNKGDNKKQAYSVQLVGRSNLTSDRAQIIPKPKILVHNNGVPTFQEVGSAWGYLYNASGNVFTLDRKLEKRQMSEAGGYVIGNDPTCDIQLELPGASKRHAFIFCRPRSQEKNPKSLLVSIHDQSSDCNDGIWINHKKIESRSVVELNTKDVIHFMDPITFSGPKVNPEFTFIAPKTVTYSDERFNSLYQTNREIGAGAYGTVSLCVCKKTGKRVAVKIIDLVKCKSETVGTSLLREVSICMAFPVHPCIIQINRVLEENNRLYMIMEHGANGDLFTNVADPSMKLTLKEFEIKIIFDQIAHAIMFLHDQNIVHRDLKMENIIMCDRRKLTVKVCDFGLSTFLKGGESLVTKCGTMMYAAPELLKLTEGGSGYGMGVDIWSLGVLLFTALTNSTPFPQLDDKTKESRDKLKHYILNGLFRFDHPNWKTVSKEAQDLIQHMMILDPTKRYTIQDIIAHPWLQNIEDDEETKQAGLSRNKELVQYLERKKCPSPILSSPCSIANQNQ